MKKIFMFLAVMGLMTFAAQYASAQEGDSLATADTTEVVAFEVMEAAAPEEVPAEAPMHQEIKRLFIEGGAGFMATLIACLVFGLAVAIERIIYLNLASTNTEKLLQKVENALNNGGVEAAKEVAAIHAVLLHLYSIRVCSATTRELKK